VTEYEYDPNGNLVLEVHAGDGGDKVTRHEYDSRNNRTHTYSQAGAEGQTVSIPFK